MKRLIAMRLWSMAVGGLLLVVSASALARPMAESTEELVRTGAAAAGREDFEACAKAYSAALAIARVHTTAGELGLCEEALGRYTLAYDDLMFAMEGEPPAAAGGAGAEPWRRFGEALERVKARVVQAIVFVEPNEAEVLVDGRSLGIHVNGRFFVLEPGKHTWTARLRGRRAVTFVHTVRAGDLPTVNLVLPSPGTAADFAAEPPCAAAEGEPLPPRICRLFERVYRAPVDPVLGLMAGGLMSVGFTADVGPGFFVGGEARWRDDEDVAFVLSAEVRTLLPTKGGTYIDDKPLDVSLVAAGLAPCLRYKWLLGCPILDIGMTIAGGPGPLTFEGSTPVILSLGLGPRLGLDLPIVERFGVRAFADMRFSLLGDANRYTVAGVRTWTNPLVSGLFGLGVSFH